MEEPHALMRWLMFHFAGGDALFFALLAAAILSVWPGDVRNPWQGTLITFVIVVWGALASPAWPPWGMMALSGVVLVWRFAVHGMPVGDFLNQHSAVLLRVTLLIATLAELSTYWASAPPAPARLGVIADSITAGLDDGDMTWPRLYAERTGVPVRDASQPGATLKSALKQAALLEDEPAVVLEIGGNDLLSGLSVDQFTSDCEALLKRVCQPGRTVWMVELPLPPLCARYGAAQRRLCQQSHVQLIPKRRLMSVLTTSGATVDSIHLSARGQKILMETMCQALGNSPQPEAIAPRYERLEPGRN
ncbi:MAG: GDSL-type esterase/lipase family protein [Planctomycetaceae bacterium]